MERLSPLMRSATRVYRASGSRPPARWASTVLGGSGAKRSPRAVQETFAAMGSPVPDGSRVVDFGDIRGLGLVSTRRIRRGEVLCRVPALAGVPHPMVLQAGKSCAECLGPIPSAVAGAQPSSQCENCEVQYCSAACATTASSNWHPAACHKRESWHVLDEGVATLRKHPMLLQRLLAASLCSPLGFEAYWDAVGLLTSSWVASDEPPPSMVARQEALKADLAGCVGGEVDKLFETALTPQWYSGVFGLLQRNAFAVPVSGVPVGQEGTALWLGVSLLNHSCEPSADITFDAGPTAVLTARCDLAIDDELTIAYIDCNAPREDRHKALATYGFNCKCPRCVAEDQ